MPDESRRATMRGDAGEPPARPLAPAPGDESQPLDDMPVPPLTDEDETKGG